ncbi:sensor histidine kinase [Bengtsoniella intestinalis]|uniref:sensor histidine kinase n=1 Tax=Bengtsoniella intestinalis TaxID=3073143 RepID=UPI00391F18FD
MKSLVQQIKAKGWSLKTVIFVAILVNTMLALLVCSTFLLTGFNRTVVDSALQSTAQSTQNIARVISSFVAEKRDQLEGIEAIWLDDNQENKEELLQAIFDLNSDIVTISVYDQWGTLVTCVKDDDAILKSNYNDNNLSFDLESIVASGGFYISAPHVNNLFYAQYPWVVTFSMETHGAQGALYYVSMDIAFSKISQYIDKISIGSRGYVYVADPDGQVIYHPKQRLIYSGLMDENMEILPQLYANGTASSETSIYGLTQVDSTNWNIIGVSSVEEMVSEKNDEFIAYGVIVILLSILLTLTLGSALSTGLTRPFQTLIDKMLHFDKDIDSFQRLGLDGFEEVRQLNATFNNMGVSIQELKDRVVYEEKELRKSELKALQSQINPHFLYNTLDSIFWLCQEKGNEDAAKMVAALSDTFRISLSRGKDTITIKDEIQHAQSYLFIQNIRYQDDFTYDIQVEPEILQCKCLKILLQPFIENAIYHGLNRMVDAGEIIIRGYSQGQDIIFEVTDNGIGMDQDQIDHLYKQNSDKAGVGVKNVHNRVKIFYGADYGVSVESELDEGTTVRIKIPRTEGDDHA